MASMAMLNNQRVYVYVYVYIYIQGLVNVLIEHHPTMGIFKTNGYLRVMFQIPKTGHLPTPGIYVYIHIYICVCV